MPADNTRSSLGHGLPPLDAVEREGDAALTKAVNELVQQAIANGGQADFRRLQRLGPAAVTLFVKTLAARSVPAATPSVPRSIAIGSAPAKSPAATEKDMVAPAKIKAKPVNTNAISSLERRVTNKSQPTKPLGAKQMKKREDVSQAQPRAAMKSRPTPKSPVTVTGWADRRQSRSSFTDRAFHLALYAGIAATAVAALILRHLGL